jgi:hypothetical protein
MPLAAVMSALGTKRTCQGGLGAFALEAAAGARRDSAEFDPGTLHFAELWL